MPVGCEAEKSTLFMAFLSQRMSPCGPKPVRPYTAAGPEDLCCLLRVSILGSGLRRYGYERGVDVEPSTSPGTHARVTIAATRSS